MTHFNSHIISIPTITDDEAYLPSYASSHAAGADIQACIKKPIDLKPNETILIPTGIRVEIPENFEIQVRPRSGLASKHGITVLNTPGTIDADYRGEIGVILINHSSRIFTVEPGMRIAQLVLARVYKGEFIKVEEISMTSRGDGGFGHTGIQGK